MRLLLRECCVVLLILLVLAARPVRSQSIELLGNSSGGIGAGAAPGVLLASGPSPEEWQEIVKILTAAGFTDEMLIRIFGVDLGGVPQRLAQNWDLVGPALTHARTLAGGFATSDALLAAAPTILVALV